jgi:hypothetical protein
MYNYEFSVEKINSGENIDPKGYSTIKSRTRNPSIKTAKTKISEYGNRPKKSNIINIYPKIYQIFHLIIQKITNIIF